MCSKLKSMNASKHKCNMFRHFVASPQKCNRSQTWMCPTIQINHQMAQPNPLTKKRNALKQLPKRKCHCHSSEDVHMPDSSSSSSVLMA